MATRLDADDREIVLRRTFAAPRELVYRAWTDPAHIGMWWGPHGFRTTTTAFDQRPGGLWRFTMHGPDGTDYPNRVTFTAVEPAVRLEYDHDADEHDGPEPFHVTVTFEDTPGGTTLTLRMRCVSAEACAHMKQFGAVEGGEQTLSRLDSFLPAPDQEVVSRRVFDAPRELVYRALTDPAHLARWWGPKGFTDTIHEYDLRPGGIWRHTMHGPDGTDYHNVCEFVEVIPNERVVFRHLEPVHAFTMSILLADVGGKTEVTWRMRFASPAECDRARSLVTAGNEQNFDRLAPLLAELAAAN